MSTGELDGGNLCSIATGGDTVERLVLAESAGESLKVNAARALLPERTLDSNEESHSASVRLISAASILD
jgi:hypothetical protein